MKHRVWVLSLALLWPFAAFAQDAESAVELRLLAQQEQIDEQNRKLEEQSRRLEQLVADREEQEAVAEVLASADSDDVASYTQAQPLKIYGYADVGWQKMMAKHRSLIGQVSTTNANTFVMGNLNLFFDAQPSESWRGLAELRFTNAPHGNDLGYASAFGTDYRRVDNSANDATSPNGRNQVVLASVVIERAWIQYSYSSALQIRTGYWLTPWGIWNIDHGTPTLISMVLPDFQTTEYFPQRQTGVQVLGSAFSGAWELGYHATLSNGRGVGMLDIDEDKAVGGRLFATHTSPEARTTVGASGYYGTFVDYTKRLEGVAPVLVETETTVEAKEWVAGADLALDSGPWRWRNEAALRSIRYTPGKRAPVSGPPGAGAPDQHAFSSYTLLAHRLPWGGLEPYTYLEFIHRPSPLGDSVIASSVGMNVHFTPAAQLKLQYSQVRFFDIASERLGEPSDHDFAVFVSRLVLAF